MKKACQSRKEAKSALDRAEWDFSSCPASEIIQCYYYEYARSSVAFCAKYEQLRKTTVPEALNGMFLYLENGYRFSLDCPEFPTTPWCKILNDLRMQRVYRRFVFIQNSCEPTYPHRPLGFDPKTGEEVLKFEVCWMATKQQLLEDFEKWIDKWVKNRQLEIDNARKSEAASDGSDGGTGFSLRRQQPVKSARELLKALGAYRLLGRMSFAEAHQLTLEDHQALYENAPAWSRAKQRAAEIITAFGEGFKLPNEILPEPVTKIT